MTDKINPESMRVAFDKNYQTFLAKNADYRSSAIIQGANNDILRLCH